jgi:anti-sigma B factor antagonist
MVWVQWDELRHGHPGRVIPHIGARYPVIVCGVVIEDVFSQTGGPANLIHPFRADLIDGKLEVNRISDLRPSSAGVMAGPGHRVDTVLDGAARRRVPSADATGVLRVNGFTEMTAHHGERFRKETSAALNGHTSIEIDLSGTTFMDCSGLSALIALRKCTRGRNGVLRLVNPAPAVRRLFEIVRAEQMFEIVETVGLHPIASSPPGA